MEYTQKKNRFSLFHRVCACFVIISFTAHLIIPPQRGCAQNVSSISTSTSLINLPAAGTMVELSPSFDPIILRGMKLFPEDPFKFEFIIDKSDNKLKEDELKDESVRMVKYFLTALTVPEDDQWVNLSPYEKDRIIPELFGQTDMGKDLLSQDYLLKQLTASLLYPEEGLGQRFWDRVYENAYKRYGTTDIPVNTFNKVWIIPERASVYEKEDIVFIVDSRLKVMLEEDYYAMEKRNSASGFTDTDSQASIASEIIREVVLPEIEQEVNSGKNFARLRQIYHSMILSTWYKRNLKEALLNRLYSDQNKIEGVDIEDKQVKEKIYQQYLEAFKQGVYDYVKEDYDVNAQEVIARRYFSGGVAFKLSGDQALMSVSAVPDTFLKREDKYLKMGVKMNVFAKGTDEPIAVGDIKVEEEVKGENAEAGDASKGIDASQETDFSMLADDNGEGKGVEDVISTIGEVGKRAIEGIRNLGSQGLKKANQFMREEEKEKRSVRRLMGKIEALELEYSMVLEKVNKLENQKPSKAYALFKELDRAYGRIRSKVDSYVNSRKLNKTGVLYEILKAYKEEIEWLHQENRGLLIVYTALASSKEARYYEEIRRESRAVWKRWEEEVKKSDIIEEVVNLWDDIRKLVKDKRREADPSILKSSILSTLKGQVNLRRAGILLGRFKVHVFGEVIWDVLQKDERRTAEPAARNLFKTFALEKPLSLAQVKKKVRKLIPFALLSNNDVKAVLEQAVTEKIGRDIRRFEKGIRITTQGVMKRLIVGAVLLMISMNVIMIAERMKSATKSEVLHYLTIAWAKEKERRLETRKKAVATATWGKEKWRILGPGQESSEVETDEKGRDKSLKPKQAKEKKEEVNRKDLEKATTVLKPKQKPRPATKPQTKKAGTSSQQGQGKSGSTIKQILTQKVKNINKQYKKEDVLKEARYFQQEAKNLKEKARYMYFSEKILEGYLLALGNDDYDQILIDEVLKAAEQLSPEIKELVNKFTGFYQNNSTNTDELRKYQDELRKLLIPHGVYPFMFSPIINNKKTIIFMFAEAINYRMPYDQEYTILGLEKYKGTIEAGIFVKGDRYPGKKKGGHWEGRYAIIFQKGARGYKVPGVPAVEVDKWAGWHEFMHGLEQRIFELEGKLQHKNIELFAILGPMIFTDYAKEYAKAVLLTFLSMNDKDDYYFQAAKGIINGIMLYKGEKYQLSDSVTQKDLDRVEKMIDKMTSKELNKIGLVMFKDPDKYLSTAKEGMYGQITDSMLNEFISGIHGRTPRTRSPQINISITGGSGGQQGTTGTGGQGQGQRGQGTAQKTEEQKRQEIEDTRRRWYREQMKEVSKYKKLQEFYQKNLGEVKATLSRPLALKLMEWSQDFNLSEYKEPYELTAVTDYILSVLDLIGQRYPDLKEQAAHISQQVFEDMWKQSLIIEYNSEEEEHKDIIKRRRDSWQDKWWGDKKQAEKYLEDGVKEQIEIVKSYNNVPGYCYMYWDLLKAIDALHAIGNSYPDLEPRVKKAIKELEDLLPFSLYAWQPTLIPETSTGTDFNVDGRGILESLYHFRILEDGKGGRYIYDESSGKRYRIGNRIPKDVEIFHYDRGRFVLREKTKDIAEGHFYIVGEGAGVYSGIAYDQVELFPMDLPSGEWLGYVHKTDAAEPHYRMIGSIAKEAGIDNMPLAEPPEVVWSSDGEAYLHFTPIYTNERELHDISSHIKSNHKLDVEKDNKKWIRVKIPVDSYSKISGQSSEVLRENKKEKAKKGYDETRDAAYQNYAEYITLKSDKADELVNDDKVIIKGSAGSGRFKIYPGLGGIQEVPFSERAANRYNISGEIASQTIRKSNRLDNLARHIAHPAVDSKLVKEEMKTLISKVVRGEDLTSFDFEATKEAFSQRQDVLMDVIRDLDRKKIVWLIEFLEKAGLVDLLDRMLDEKGERVLEILSREDINDIKWLWNFLDKPELSDVMDRFVNRYSETILEIFTEKKAPGAVTWLMQELHEKLLDNIAKHLLDVHAGKILKSFAEGDIYLDEEFLLIVKKIVGLDFIFDIELLDAAEGSTVHSLAKLIRDDWIKFKRPINEEFRKEYLLWQRINDEFNKAVKEIDNFKVSHGMKEPLPGMPFNYVLHSAPLKVVIDEIKHDLVAITMLTWLTTVMMGAMASFVGRRGLYKRDRVLSKRSAQDIIDEIWENHPWDNSEIFPDQQKAREMIEKIMVIRKAMTPEEKEALKELREELDEQGQMVLDAILLIPVDPPSGAMKFKRKLRTLVQALAPLVNGTIMRNWPLFKARQGMSEAILDYVTEAPSNITFEAFYDGLWESVKDYWEVVEVDGERLIPPEELREKVDELVKKVGNVIDGRVLDEKAVGAFTTKERGEGGEFLEIRDYVPGDDFRKINWQGTGRSQRTKVNVTSSEGRVPTMILIDLRKIGDIDIDRWLREMIYSVKVNYGKMRESQGNKADFDLSGLVFIMPDGKVKNVEKVGKNKISMDKGFINLLKMVTEAIIKEYRQLYNEIVPQKVSFYNEKENERYKERAEGVFPSDGKYGSDAQGQTDFLQLNQILAGRRWKSMIYMVGTDIREREKLRKQYKHKKSLRFIHWEEKDMASGKMGGVARTQDSSRELEASQKVEENTGNDKAMMSEVGGIDFHSRYLNMERKGKRIKWNFSINAPCGKGESVDQCEAITPVNVEKIPVRGVTPDVLYIAPVTNLLLMLGK